MHKKKFVAFTLIVLMLTSFFVPTVAAAVTYEPENTQISCESAYMVNLDTDTPIYAKNEDEMLCPASLTKIMTATLVLESLSEEQLQTKIPCPESIMNDPYWVNASASISGFVAGEEVRIIDLLYALILQSACEIGDVLGDYVGREIYGGDIQTFIDKMNTRAKELGCENTHFVNTHGLHDDNQYSTAYDLYLITKNALEYPLFREIAGTAVYEVAPTNKTPENKKLIHTHQMLFSSSEYYYKAAKGVKTGTTDENTQNLATLAEQDGFSYLLIAMGGLDRNEAGVRTYTVYKDSLNLLKWAFNSFEIRNVLETKDLITEIPVRLSTTKDHIIALPAEDVSLLMPDSIDLSAIQRIPHVDKVMDAPIQAGEKIGTLELKLKDETLATVDLVSDSTVERSTFLFIGDQIRKFFSQPIIKIALILLVILIIAYVIFATWYNKKKKARRSPYRMSNRRR
ncbi:MAG: D-alanyl-D-alanine carboxypeptidase family protein [Massiliimalia sp.]|jgi:D-alanyl-D-alanine carboxypeptidase (penicillin-binding protein 5/6)